MSEPRGFDESISASSGDVVGLSVHYQMKIDALTVELAAVKKERDTLMNMSITGIRMMKIVRDGMQTIEKALAEIDKESER